MLFLSDLSKLSELINKQNTEERAALVKTYNNMTVLDVYDQKLFSMA